MLPDISGDLLDFLAERLKVHMRGGGTGYVGDVQFMLFRHDLIAAVFALAEDDFVRLLARAVELNGFLATDDGANLLVAYRRASNIVGIEERRDIRSYDSDVEPALLAQREERDLATMLAEVGERAGTFLKGEEFGMAMSELARLRRPVDDFFDKVTVNCDEPTLRENRLRLLSRIRATLNRVADFSQIEG
jgi:glycyl-tRNA synthetase beta chain